MSRPEVFLPSDELPPQDEPWEPLRVRRQVLAAEIDRLAALPATSARESLIVHPHASEVRPSLAPGIRVTLGVLLPGERTATVRHNATELGFCIEGRGVAFVGDTTIRYAQYDVWNVPGWTSKVVVNDSSERLVLLTYSNAPVLEALGVHRFDDLTAEDHHRWPERSGVPAEEIEGEKRDGGSPACVELESPGAWLMPYEMLVSPPAQNSPPLHWPWREVRAQLDRLAPLGKEYRGRRLYLLYNPATGRTNGTTPSFFAAITLRPPRIVDRPHRHASAAINYFFAGSGYSTIGGHRYEWEAGDLMLTAPGWMIHNHASGDGAVYELTVQDQPYHIALESLLWQEDLKSPPRLLGTNQGFVTNRAELGS
jgi:gentisate 1,2-dioxygenase